MSLNYGVTLVCFLTPVMLLAYKGAIGTTTAIVLAGGGSIGFPLALLPLLAELVAHAVLRALSAAPSGQQGSRAQHGPGDENV